ncbi:MAG: trehalose-phosphatase, partial [Sandaracinaceae bacterium]
RDLSDLRARVGVDEVTYAGGHGLAVVGPDLVFEHDALRDAAPRLARACEDLRDRIGAIDGVELELKGGALAVHYRRADAARERSVESAARDVAESIGGLRCTYGKKIVELRPDVAWDKGRAVRLLVRRWFAPEDRVVPIYVGDDLTDEDAFRELARDGLGVLVGDHGGHTRARYALADSDEVFDFVGAMREIDSVTCETDSGAT